MTGYVWAAAGLYFLVSLSLAKPEDGTAASVQVYLLVFGAVATAPSIFFVVLGTLLAKGARLAPLGILSGACIVLPLAAAIGSSILFPDEYPVPLLVQVAGLLLVLVPTASALQGSADALGPVRSPGLERVRRRPWLVAIALPVLLVGLTLGLRLSIAAATDDARLVRFRSNAYVIHQAVKAPMSWPGDRDVHGPYSLARDELHHRGSS